MTAWRWRRCPCCGAVMPSGELIQVRYVSNWNTYGGSERQCPHCGHRAPTYQFRVVREKHNA